MEFALFVFSAPHVMLASTFVHYSLFDFLAGKDRITLEWKINGSQKNKKHKRSVSLQILFLTSNSSAIRNITCTKFKYYKG